MAPALPLAEIVREARARTDVPGVAAGLLAGGETTFAAEGILELGQAEPVHEQTPFRIASISKPFTAGLCLSVLPLDDRLAGWLGHTGGLRPETGDPLPENAQGLFSYANAGYWAAGEAVAAATGGRFAEAMEARILAPLALAATGYVEPPRAARGHVQEGESGHRPVAREHYPERRWPSGGLWSTTADLLRFAAHHLGGPGPLTAELVATMRQPRSRALGGGYGLGWWCRDSGGAMVLDHEGSVGGFQSLLLLRPDAGIALAVLTNSWRGSGLVRRVVEALELVPPPDPVDGAAPRGIGGRYELGDAEADVEPAGAATLAVTEAETDPVTGARRSIRYRADHLGEGVFGVAGGALMSHRLDFPRPGIARIGWVALPRVRP